jgi:hypothetical protein
MRRSSKLGPVSKNRGATGRRHAFASFLELPDTKFFGEKPGMALKAKKEHGRRSPDLQAESPNLCLKDGGHFSSQTQKSVNYMSTCLNVVDTRRKLPDGNFRRRCIGGVSRNGAALCQHLRIGLDVRFESDLNDVMNSIGSQSPDSFH